MPKFYENGKQQNGYSGIVYASLLEQVPERFRAGRRAHRRNGEQARIACGAAGPVKGGRGCESLPGLGHQRRDHALRGAISLRTRCNMNFATRAIEVKVRGAIPHFETRSSARTPGKAPAGVAATARARTPARRRLHHPVGERRQALPHARDFGVIDFRSNHARPAREHREAPWPQGSMIMLWP